MTHLVLDQLCEEHHTPMPEGYVERMAWCERRSKTHVQKRCPGCGRWAVWVPRDDPRAREVTSMGTITLGVRVKPSRHDKRYRDYYDEMLTDIQVRINERRAEDDSDAAATVKAIRRFAKRSDEHREYALLILELWDVG